MKAAKNLVFAFKGYNVFLILMASGIRAVWLVSPQTVLARVLAQEAAADPYASLAAGISTGLAALGAGVAVSGTGQPPSAPLLRSPKPWVVP